MACRLSLALLLLAPTFLALLPGCPADPDDKDTGKPADCDQPQIFYQDADGDGFGVEASSQEACRPPEGYTAQAGDCDDTNARVYPEATEACDGLDNDCDGATDEDVQTVYYPDNDGDGFGADDHGVMACDKPAGFVTTGGDCDDNSADAHPGGTEVCDRYDNDCDGQVDEDGAGVTTWYEDADRDGYGDRTSSREDCNQPPGYVDNPADCDDTNADVNPAEREICDALDNDCDGLTDSDDPDATGSATWYRDSDGDSFGDARTTKSACDQPAGYVADSSDCDDRDADVNPTAVEICDSQDNDCDGYTDDADSSVSGALTYYRDSDRDAYGDPTVTKTACSTPSGYVSSGTDCDDANARVNPGAAETCDDADQDCDGFVDEEATDATDWYKDGDGDGYGLTTSTVEACDAPVGYTSTKGDCEDSDASIYPGATEVCNEVDDDCDGSVDEGGATGATWYADADGDGFGNARTTKTACVQPSGYVSSADDCDDTDGDVYPGAPEYCDGDDDNCNGDVDEAPVDGVAYATDDDGDGFGEPGTTIVACDGVENELDCDDTDPGEPQVVDGTATGAADGSSAHPWHTIQDGIDAASMCVVVAAATYEENLDFGGKGVSVFGIEGATSTIIDGGRAGPVVTFDSSEGADSELAGFTLTNGMGFASTSEVSYACGSSSTCIDHYSVYCGGGIYIGGATPTLHDLVVTSNDLTMPDDTSSGTDYYYYMSYGGGICFRDTTITLEQVDLISNYADDGGGAYVESTAAVTFNQAFVAGNTAETGAGFEVDGGNLTLTNVAFSFNEASTEGGGVRAIDATLREVNVSHAKDDAPTGGGIYASGSSSSVTLMNTIVYGSPTGAGVLLGTGTTLSASYNDVYGNATNYSGVTDPTGSSGNISSNPKFTSVTDDGNVLNEDLRLGSGSPCIDTGNPSTSYNDADGTRNDMGAFGGVESNWSTVGAAATDNDGDGYNSTTDCDDSDADVYPGAIEYCDSVDNDCNGLVDDSCISTSKFLLVTEIMYNPSGTEPDEEYFEVYNYGSSSLDLSNALIYSSGSGGEQFYVAPRELSVAAGSYAVFCYDDAVLGRDCDYIYGSDVHGTSTYGATFAADFTLTNSGVTLQISDSSGALLDEVTYTGSSPWPTSKNGYAISVDPSLLTHALRADASAWCTASSKFATDYGTPGARNDSCP